MKRFLLKGKKLVIAEKSEAGSRIANFLGCTERNGYWKSSEYLVAPARGHLLGQWLHGLRVRSIYDLPATDEYWRVSKRDKPQLELLKKLTKETNSVVIATDFDREGEVIGWNIYRECTGASEPSEIPRAYFSALTESELDRAFSGITPMDEALLTQGLARQLTDTITGLNLTKAFTILFKDKFGKKQLTQSISSGRVQSPLLSHVSGKTKVDYRTESNTWEFPSYLHIYIETDKGDVRVPSKLKDELNNVEEVEITGFEEREETTEQAEKFPSTNQVQRELPIRPESMMKIGESLYLKGWSTYPRTKESSIPPEMLNSVYDSLVETGYDREGFVPENAEAVNPAGKKQAIVPTPEGIRVLAEGRVKGREKMFMKYLVAKLMRGLAPPLKVKKKIARLEWNDKKEEMEWGEECENTEDAISDRKFTKYPEIKTGTYKLKRVRSAKRSEEINEKAFDPTIKVYSDGELVRWLTSEGLGTEATRHNFPTVLRNRKYIDNENLPTSLGTEVSKILDNMETISPELTSEMEKRIGSLDYLNELNEYKEWVVIKTREMLAELQNTSINPKFECPKGHKATLKNTRNGLFLLCQECEKFHEL